MAADTCRCRHLHEAHEHFHGRAYCSVCTCRGFRPSPAGLAAAAAARIRRTLALIRRRT